jgi:hypothetical protein
MPLRSMPIEFVRNNRWSKTTSGRIIGRPQEAIMATTSRKTGLFAFDPARCALHQPTGPLVATLA